LEAVPEEGTMFRSPVFKFLDFLLGIPIIHDVLFGVYREQVVEKAEKMGLDWRGFMKEQLDSMSSLQSAAKQLEDPKVVIPDYYYAPIHAYKDGNLCWESAMEEDLWSKLMIAPLYNNALDGDVQMRRQWLTITGRSIKGSPKTATDLGCGTGLSMYMLDAKFPTIEHITGIDLSTFKLAVCEEKRAAMVSCPIVCLLKPLSLTHHYVHLTSIQPESRGSKYTLIHGPAESTPVEAGTQDLVSLCLVAHESPKWVSESIFREAFRILKPGGTFTMLDLDKNSLEVHSHPSVVGVRRNRHSPLSTLIFFS
jgi:ubiquinone/menaquinone biosynthesis C-methylase UbiE